MSETKRENEDTWLVVADGEVARAFRAEAPGWELAEVEEFALRQEILPGQQLDADRPGCTSDRFGHALHAMEPPTDPKRKQKEVFLREVSAALDQAAEEEHFQSLVLVAPPRTLGILRRHLGDATRARLHEEISRDLTGLTPHELQRWLVRHAGPTPAVAEGGR